MPPKTATSSVPSTPPPAGGGAASVTPTSPVEITTFLSSPAGLAFLKNILQDPESRTAYDHNFLIVQACTRVQLMDPLYMLPQLSFPDDAALNLWYSGVVQSNQPHMPPLPNRVPLASVHNWKHTAIVLPVTLPRHSDKAAAAFMLFTNLYPAAFPTELTAFAPAQIQSDALMYPAPVFDNEAVVYDLIKFHLFHRAIELYYQAKHLRSMSSILGPTLQTLYLTINTVTYTALDGFDPSATDADVQWGWVVYDRRQQLISNIGLLVSELAAIFMPPKRFFDGPAFDIFTTRLLSFGLTWSSFLESVPAKSWKATVIKGLPTQAIRDAVGLFPKQDFVSFVRQLISSKSSFHDLPLDPYRAAASPPPKTGTAPVRSEGKRANAIQMYQDPDIKQGGCINRGCPSPSLHRVRQCTSKCNLPECTKPEPHIARHCSLVYGDDAGPYFARVLVSRNSCSSCSPAKNNFLRAQRSRCHYCPVDRRCCR
jgi:hypothetical protein